MIQVAMTTLATLWAAGTQPAAQAEAGPLLWLEIANTATTVRSLAPLPAAPLLALFASQKDVQRLGGADTRALFAYYRDGRGRPLRQVLLQEAAGDAKAATHPLSATAEYTELAKHEAEAALFGRLDVLQLYGRMVQGSRGRMWAGLLDRLGLASATAVSFAGKINASTLQVHAQLALKKLGTGMLAAMGPPIPAVLPGWLPRQTSGYLRVSVRPAALYTLVQKLAGYHSPLEWALVQAHLDTVEAQSGKRLFAILGETPRTWTTYVTAEKGGRLSQVLVAPVADGPGLVAYLDALAALVSALTQGGSLKRTRNGTVTYFSFDPGGTALEPAVFAVAGNTLLVGSRRASLDAYLSAHAKKDKVLAWGPVLISGAAKDGLAAELLLRGMGLWGALGERAGASGVSLARLKSALCGSFAMHEDLSFDLRLGK